MSFFSRILGRQKKVTNEKLSDDISKLCEELTSGIIELSIKANKINELKEKYKQSESELEDSTTNPENGVTKPVEEKSFLSSIFGSEENKTLPPPPDQPAPEAAPAVAVDNIDDTNLPSEASTLQLASSEKPLGSSEDIYIPDESTGSSSDTPPPPPIEPMGASEGIYNPAVSTGDILSPLETLPAPASPENSSTVRGGKNMKKSKRSKKTIRKTDKKSNRVTKKQKVNNADDKARAQGLAQAKLQAQGQSMI